MLSYPQGVKMLVRDILKPVSALTVLVAAGILAGSQYGKAANDNNGAQDEREMIQIGMTTAASTGIHLNITSQDTDLVGLGSYIVNVTSDCNLCHSPAFITTSFTPNGNPYLLPPVYSGHKMVDPTVYLGGNQNFGPPAPGYANIISRNLTPDKTGQPEGHTLAQFIQIMRTGIDLDNAHPTCALNATVTTNCVPFPINGALLQVMPWSAFQAMTDRQLTAIYTYLSTLPCLEGGPGEPASRCDQ
jgi:hypothetical protein